MRDTRVSALTLARGRSAHLANVIRGLNQQTCPPAELVIAVMQETLYTDLPDADFPIRQIKVTGTELPLSRARNIVAKHAKFDTLVFLDVDCIPAPELIADYASLVEPGAGLFMGEVMYLPAGATDAGWTFAEFDEVAVRHSDRQGPPVARTKPCGDYRCFWSLNFAIHRADWDISGGFDEDFVGYGGEDTDFGRTLEDRGVAISWLRGARVYHQYHEHCMPPVHHISSILRNTEIFGQKWGHRTMEHWLRAFRLMGLVDDTPDGLRQIREPSRAQIDLCFQQKHMPFASSGQVLQLLEENAARVRTDEASARASTPRHRHDAHATAAE
ncbi:glycosyltransferase [Sulfitobacter sp. S190]|nr:glycosyltransferase [Sulfitobacter sp. S190]